MALTITFIICYKIAFFFLFKDVEIMAHLFLSKSFLKS